MPGSAAPDNCASQQRTACGDQIDADGAISGDAAGINDVIAEFALSSIMDCETVATVDAEDKVLARTNWDGLMRGTLEETFEKGGRTMTRRLADDIAYTAADGSAASLKARALMLVRNVVIWLPTRQSGFPTEATFRKASWTPL